VTPNAATRQRLAFMSRIVDKEVRLLLDTRRRLFTPDMNAQRLQALESDPVLADRIEAFVSRFWRLQDTVGDKLLPLTLAALGEKVGPFADNLDRAERLGWIASSDAWFAMRALRNQMVHEYVEDPQLLWQAIVAGSQFTDDLVRAALALIDEGRRRGWLDANPPGPAV